MSNIYENSSNALLFLLYTPEQVFKMSPTPFLRSAQLCLATGVSRHVPDLIFANVVSNVICNRFQVIQYFWFLLIYVLNCSLTVIKVHV